MQFLWKYIEDLVGKGLDIPIIAKLLFYISASLIPMALPLAILLASLMTFGNLGENYELTAIKSAGISLQKLMTPLIILTLVISIIAFYISNNIIPMANLKMRSLLYDIEKQKPAFQIKEGIFYNGIDGYSIKVGRKSKKNNMLYDMKIYDHTENKGNIKLTVADSALMKMTEDEKTLIITLFNGYNYIEMHGEYSKRSSNYPHRKDRFCKQQLMLDLSGFGLNRTDENLFRNSYKMMNIAQLNAYEDAIVNEMQVVKQAYHEKIISHNYFKTIVYRNEPDTFSGIGLPLHRDPAYMQLPSVRKLQVIKQALYNARRTSDYLFVVSGDLNRRKKNLVRYQIEWHRKFTLSFACFIFFFIGAPLGAIIRKGGFGMPVVISILFFIIYYIISISGEKFVKELVTTPVEGMWFPSLILLPLGIFLTYKATHESTLFNIDTYTLTLKKIRDFIRNNRKK